MQEYKNASKGLNTAFVTQLIILLSAVATALTTGFYQIEKSLVIGVVAFSLGIATIICEIIYLFALKKASLDCKDFLVAFKIEIASIVFSLIGIILDAIPAKDALGKVAENIYPTIDLVSRIFDIFVVYFVITACVKLLEKTGNQEYSKKGRKVFKIYEAAFILTLIIGILADVIPEFYSNMPLIVALVVIISSLAIIVLTIVYSILYLLFIKKTSNYLSKKG